MDPNGTDCERKRNSAGPTASQPSSKKSKASNFQMTEIVIGDWRRPTMRVGDLTAKVYYAKRKLVWEILDGALKSKMEIHWSDITAIKAVMLGNQDDILQIELDKPPSFYEEIPPQPIKHTTWKQTHDFTGGQASLCRRHFATIPSGFLEKHYEKLIHSDEHLFELSQKPFPSQACPYFDIGPSFDASEPPFNFNGPMAQQYPSQCNFNGQMAQQYPSQCNLNGPMTRQYPYPLPPENVAVAGNQFVNTPNRNAGAWDAERRHFPMATPLLCNEERMDFSRANPSLCNAEMTLLPRANPSPQPQPSCNDHRVFPGHNYPFNNIENHEMQQSQIGLPSIDEAQRIGPSLFINPNSNINNYQMSDVNEVMMLQNNGPFVQPDTSLQMGTHLDGNSPRSYDEDLFGIYLNATRRK